ncbi:AMP-binding protein [Actinomadura sp. KC345]|uniref:AMP-binding protein n=1 Tax=Actinomadura sp. KC345 TaxID=2530371 RepID=UPI001A9DA68E|nr:AMP-binding protein [Actinomadura sp. KC345]
MGAKTVGAVLRDAAARDKAFLYDGDETVTYPEFDALADRVAGGLLARGIGRGDRIALLGLNTPQWLAAFFGAARIGAVVVPLNVRYREQELSSMLGQSDARMVISVSALPDFDFAAFFEGSGTGFPASATTCSSARASPAARRSTSWRRRPAGPRRPRSATPWTRPTR